MESARENQKKQRKPRKPPHPLSGFAIVATLWLWGALLFWAPTYLIISGGWEKLFDVLGAVVLIISFVGALVELGNIWKNEAWSYWGAGLVFLIPAIILLVLERINSWPPVWETVARAAVLSLLAIGGPFFFMGIPYLVRKGPQMEEVKRDTETALQESADKKTTKREARFVTIASIVIALLSLATAIVKLIYEVIP